MTEKTTLMDTPCKRGHQGKRYTNGTCSKCKRTIHDQEYEQTEAARKRQANYQASDKGKERTRRYHQTEKGKAALAEAQKRYRKRKKEMRNAN